MARSPWRLPHEARAVFVGLLGLASACADDSPPAAPPGAGNPTTGVGMPSGNTGDPATDAGLDGGLDESGITCSALDVLMVVDNSVSMIEEQAALGSYTQSLLELFDTPETEVDYRLAVAHSSWASPGTLGFVSPGVEGATLQTAAMSVPYLTRADPSAAASLRQMLEAGGQDFDPDEHLQVARAALVDQPNAGFLREDVPLGIVVVTDSDDQSLAGGDSARIQALLDDFDAAAGGREAWALAVVAGDRDPRCTSELGEAIYAEGLAAFVESAGDNAVLASLCPGDLGAALGRAFGKLFAVCDAQQPAADAEP